MKKLLLTLTALMFLTNLGYSEDFTVEKVSNTVGKIVTSKNVVSEENITITQLKQRKENLSANKIQAEAQYKATLATIDNEIALIDIKIAELKKIGVVEP